MESREFLLLFILILGVQTLQVLDMFIISMLPV